MAVKEAPYDIGDDLELSATFTDSAGSLINPTTVGLQIVCPDGTELDYTIADLTHPGVGLFTRVYRVANGWGVYRVTWDGQGAFAIVEQDSFRVRKPAAP